MPDIPTEKLGDVLTIGTWEFWNILCFVTWKGKGGLLENLIEKLIKI